MGVFGQERRDPRSAAEATREHVQVVRRARRRAGCARRPRTTSNGPRVERGMHEHRDASARLEIASLARPTRRMMHPAYRRRQLRDADPAARATGRRRAARPTPRARVMTARTPFIPPIVRHAGWCRRAIDRELEGDTTNLRRGDDDIPPDLELRIVDQTDGDHAFGVLHARRNLVCALPLTLVRLVAPTALRKARVEQQGAASDERGEFRLDRIE